MKQIIKHDGRITMFELQTSNWKNNKYQIFKLKPQTYANIVSNNESNYLKLNNFNFFQFLSYLQIDIRT
jgi:hypothetical protein